MKKKQIMKKLTALALGASMVLSMFPNVQASEVNAQSPVAKAANNMIGDYSFEEDIDFITKQLGNDNYQTSRWYAFAGPQKYEGEAHTGNWSVKVPGSDAAIEQDLDKNTLQKNTVYTAKVWAKTTNADQYVYFGVKNYGGTEIKVRIDSTEYKEYTIPFTYTGTGNPRIYVWAEYLNGATVYADDFSVTAIEDIDDISFENGKITVQFSEDYDGAVSADMFSATLTNSIKPDEKQDVALAQVSAEGKTLVMSYDEVEALPVAQEIAVTLTYKTSGKTYAGNFVVDANGEEVVKPEVETLTAENGLVTAVLKEVPTIDPIKENFVLQYKIDAGEYENLSVKEFAYDKSTKTVTFKVATLEVKEEVQKVTVKVTCDGKDTETTYNLEVGEGTFYYVDATGGDDANDGTSPETAWKSFDKVNDTVFQAGDHILFKCGETWTGELMPQGSGFKGNPIVISSYGEGDKPVFKPGSDRVLPYFNVATDVLWNKKINNAISFFNQQHWEIRNLELYDPEFDAHRPSRGYGQKDSDVYRRAINLMAEDAGDLYGFTIDNVTMHGFRGPNSNRGKSSGGVIVTILSDPYDAANRVPTGIHDITVTNCEMYDLGRSGFNFSSPWTTRRDVGEDKWGLFGYAGYGDWKPCENIYIANNIIHDIDGDGVLIDGCENVLVEHNVVYRTARYAEMAVGMFNWNSDNTIFQFNEVYDVCPSDYEGETHDAQGIEIDALNRDTWVQYNYVHNNRGGVFMWCDTGDLRGFRGIYRYNISQNDGNLHGVIDWRPNHVDSAIYNNTIYIGGSDYVRFLNTNGGNVAQNPKAYNNIFYNTNENLSTYDFLENQIDWKNNIFYNFDRVPADASNIQADPKLVAPGTGEKGLDSVDGYQLLADSPAIDAGIEVADNGGRDYFGNLLTDGKTDIGAAEYGVAEEVDKEDLAFAIDYAKSQQADENYAYVVPAVKKAFEAALANAEAVMADEAATQDTVDAAYDKLLEMCSYLLFTGNSESLKVLVDEVKAMNLDIYTEETRAAIEEALANAEAVLANENALQDEIDAARDALQTAMDNLVLNPVDKSKLEKLVKKADKYLANIDEYTDVTKGIFTEALDEAKAVLANDKATQEDVDLAYANLQNAIFGLRFIPNKDKLEELINKAEALDLSKYTAETAAAVNSALARAQVVFEDENATEEDVKKAEKDLQKAMSGLKLAGDTTNKDNNKTDKKDTTKPAKTGDSAMPMVFMLLAAASVVVVFKKKRA